MQLALISDAFPPLRSSGAVQLRDLSRELVRQGHEVTVMVASPNLGADYCIENLEGVRVVRLRTPKTKDVNYVRRTLGEFLMPYAMLRNLRKTGLAETRWDGVVWYSPSIFLGPMVNALKRASNCPSYLILRDIFPEWAVEMGLMGRGLPYRFFKGVANYQYSVASVIGVQTAGNLEYFAGSSSASATRVEVLHNWLADAQNSGCSINIAETPLSGRKIFVYAGNMGVAQGMGILLDLAARLTQRSDIGFLFVGRGSDAKRLRDDAAVRGLDNVMFFDEIDPDEIPGLYAQCHAGLVALDPRHKSHNIPGKFLSYMQSALPVLASINHGNDLVGMIREKRVGAVCTDNSSVTLARLAIELISQSERDPQIKHRCRRLAKDMFSAEAAALNVTAALELEYESTSDFSRSVGRVDQQGASVPAEEAAPQYSSRL
jgi:glycosyltransferase involved in cell wall biosynthesis